MAEITKKADIEFLSPNCKDTSISKLKPINALAFIIDDYAVNPCEMKTVTVYSEVHNNLQDLAATLFRRGVMIVNDSRVSVVYGPRSIVKVVASV